MQIVINIPENVYKELNTYLWNSLLVNDELMILENAFQKATLLPKGHGRLVDADAILADPFGNTYKDIEIAETILKADTESEDKE